MAEAWEKLRDKIITSIKTSNDPLKTIATEINSYLNSNAKVSFKFTGTNASEATETNVEGSVSLSGSAVSLLKSDVTETATLPDDPTTSDIDTITSNLKSYVTSAIKTGIGKLALVYSTAWQLDGKLSACTNYATTSFSNVYFKKVDVNMDSDISEVQKESIGELCKNLISKVETLKGAAVTGKHLVGGYIGGGTVTSVTVE